MDYNISVGVDLGLVSGKTLTWGALVDKLSRHDVAGTKGGS